MKLKISRVEIRSMLEPMRKLALTRLPAKVWYWLGRDIDAVLSVCKNFDETRNKLVKIHGANIDPKNPEIYEVLPEKVADYIKEFNDFANEQEEIELHQISVSALGGLEFEGVDPMLAKYLFVE